MEVLVRYLLDIWILGIDGIFMLVFLVIYWVFILMFVLLGFMVDRLEVFEFYFIGELERIIEVVIFVLLIWLVFYFEDFGFEVKG